MLAATYFIILATYFMIFCGAYGNLLYKPRQPTFNEGPVKKMLGRSKPLSKGAQRRGRAGRSLLRRRMRGSIKS